MGISVVGFADAPRRLFEAVFAAPPFVASATALAALACVPLFFGPFSRQISAFTSLWLSSLGLTLMARSRWTAFAVLFAIASLNKETSILLTLVFAVHVFRHRAGSSAPEVRRLLAYQIVAYAAIRGAVAYAFRD